MDYYQNYEAEDENITNNEDEFYDDNNIDNQFEKYDQKEQFYNNHQQRDQRQNRNQYPSNFNQDYDNINDAYYDQDYDDTNNLVQQSIQLIRRGKVNEGLEKTEIAIYRAQEMKGPQGFQKSFTQIIKALNNESVTSLNNNDWETTLLILTKCDSLTQPHKFGVHTTLRALTYNNFGCYFRRMQDLPNALNSLEKALRLLNMSNMRENLGLTHLNLCAVLSQMGEHHASLENAKKAVIELHKDYLDYIKGKDINELKKNPEFIQKATSLAIAFHNVGVEEEHFQNYEMCLLNYGNSCQVAEDNLGAHHKLTMKFRQLFNEFNKKLTQAEQNPKKIRASTQKSNLRKRPYSANKNINNLSQQKQPPQTPYSRNLFTLENKIQPYKTAYNTKPTQFQQIGNEVRYKQPSFNQRNNSNLNKNSQFLGSSTYSNNQDKYSKYPPQQRPTHNNFFSRSTGVTYKPISSNQNNNKVKFEPKYQQTPQQNNFINNDNQQKRPMSAKIQQNDFQQGIRPQSAQNKQKSRQRHQKHESQRITAKEEAKQLEGIISWSDSSEGEENLLQNNRQNFIENLKNFNNNNNNNNNNQKRTHSYHVNQDQQPQNQYEQRNKTQQQTNEQSFYNNDHQSSQKEQDIQKRLEELKMQEKETEQFQEKQRKLYEQEKLKEQEERIQYEQEKEKEEQERQQRLQELQELEQKQKVEQEKLEKIKLLQQQQQQLQQKGLQQSQIVQSNYIQFGQEEKLTQDGREGHFSCFFEKNLFILIFCFRDILLKQGKEIKDQCQHNIRFDSVWEKYGEDFQTNEYFVKTVTQLMLQVKKSFTLQVGQKILIPNVKNFKIYNKNLLDENEETEEAGQIQQINQKLSFIKEGGDEEIQQQEQVTEESQLNNLMKKENEYLKSQQNIHILQEFEPTTLQRRNGILARYFQGQESYIFQFMYFLEDDNFQEPYMTRHTFDISTCTKKHGDYQHKKNTNYLQPDSETLSTKVINLMVQYYDDKMSFYAPNNTLFYHDIYTWSTKLDHNGFKILVNIEQKDDSNSVLQVMKQRKSDINIQEQPSESLLSMVGANLDFLADQATKIASQKQLEFQQDNNVIPEQRTQESEQTPVSQPKYDKQHELAAVKLQSHQRKRIRVQQRQRQYKSRFQTYYKKMVNYQQYRLYVWVYQDTKQNIYKYQIYTLESRIERQNRGLYRVNRTIIIQENIALEIEKSQKPLDYIEINFEQNSVILKQKEPEKSYDQLKVEVQPFARKSVDILFQDTLKKVSESEEIQQQHLKIQQEKEIRKSQQLLEQQKQQEEEEEENYDEDDFEQDQASPPPPKKEKEPIVYDHTHEEAAKIIQQGLIKAIRVRNAKENLRKTLRAIQKTIMSMNIVVNEKLIQFSMVKKFNPRSFQAHAQRLYTKSDQQKWNKSIILPDIIAKEIGIEYREKNKNINILQYFEVNPDKDIFKIAHDTEQRLAIRSIQRKVQSYYQILAKEIIIQESGYKLLVTIIKNMRSKQQFNAQLETIKSPEGKSSFNSTININKMLAKNIIRLYQCKQPCISNYFTIQPENEIFELHKIGKETLAVLTIQRTLRWLTQSRQAKEKMKAIIEEARRNQKIKILFQKRFVYQTHKLIFTLVHDKVEKYSFAHLQAYDIDRSKDHNKVNLKANLPIFLAKYIANEFAQKQKQFTPQQYFEIECFHNIFKVKKDKIEDLLKAAIIQWLSIKIQQRKLREIMGKVYHSQLTYVQGQFVIVTLISRCERSREDPDKIQKVFYVQVQPLNRDNDNLNVKHRAAKLEISPLQMKWLRIEGCRLQKELNLNNYWQQRQSSECQLNAIKHMWEKRQKKKQMKDLLKNTVRVLCFRTLNPPSRRGPKLLFTVYHRLQGGNMYYARIEAFRRKKNQKRSEKIQIQRVLALQLAKEDRLEKEKDKKSRDPYLGYTETYFDIDFSNILIEINQAKIVQLRQNEESILTQLDYISPEVQQAVPSPRALDTDRENGDDQFNSQLSEQQLKKLKKIKREMTPLIHDPPAYSFQLDIQEQQPVTVVYYQDQYKVDLQQKELDLQEKNIQLIPELKKHPILQVLEDLDIFFDYENRSIQAEWKDSYSHKIIRNQPVYIFHIPVKNYILFQNDQVENRIRHYPDQEINALHINEYINKNLILNIRNNNLILKVAQEITKEDAALRIQKKFSFKYYRNSFKINKKKETFEIQGQLKLGKNIKDVWVTIVTHSPDHNRHFYVIKNFNYRKAYKSIKLIMKHIKYDEDQGIYLDFNKLLDKLQEGTKPQVVLIKHYEKQSQNDIAHLQAVWYTEKDEIIFRQTPEQQEKLPLNLIPYRHNLNNKVPKNQLIPLAEEILKSSLIYQRKIYYFSQKQINAVRIIQRYWKMEQVVRKYQFQLSANINQNRVLKFAEAQVVKSGYNYALKLYTREQYDNPDSKLLTDKIVLLNLNKDSRQDLLRNLVYLIQSNTMLIKGAEDAEVKFIDKNFLSNKTTIQFNSSQGPVGQPREIQINYNQNSLLQQSQLQ